MSCPRKLIDPFGRHINYLRVSVTDRCDFRCTYCMKENMTFLPRKDLLTYHEIDRLCSAFVGLGVRKIRITGGEPLLRRNIMTLFETLSRHLDGGGLTEMTLTTNGSQLQRYAQSLKDVGVQRVNVSLDSLVPERFEKITRRGNFNQVMGGIDAAQAAGMEVKINVVALRGINDDEIDSFIRFTHNRGMDLTFIETMPMGEVESDRTIHFLPLIALRRQMEMKWTLEEIDLETGGPAKYVRVAETGGRIGFITPLTHNFCESCNRVRLTCTGILYLCLGQENSFDLRRVLRASDDPSHLYSAIAEAIRLKPEGHDFVIDQAAGGRPVMTRHMSVTGG